MADWTIAVCDLNGNSLAGLQRIASKRQLSYRLNRPAQLSFELPADDPRTAQLQAGRVVKAWRREGSTSTLRFAGYVWQVADEGDADTYKTKVVCFDPFQRLTRRLCRDSGNNVPADGKVSFAAVQAELIARNLIDRTNTGGGVCGLRTNAVGPSVGTRTADYEWRDVASVIVELCETTGLNFYVEPEDRTDGYLGYIVLQGTLSNVATNALVWGGPTHNASKVERTEDMSKFADDLRVLGVAAGQSTRPIAARTSAGAITTYGRYEDVHVYGDLTVQSYIDSLADQEIALRDSPYTIAKFTPQPDPGSPNAMNPFIDFKLGYLINVYAGSKLRGGFSGQQRIWGFDLELDDNGVERIASISVGADA